MNGPMHNTARSPSNAPGNQGGQATERSIPYSFARKHGVVLRGQPEPTDGISLVFRAGGDPRSLLEVRRYLGFDFDVKTVEAAEFDRFLSEHYAASGGAAAELQAGSDELDILAADIPSIDDLLDSADDAPAIRLINAIIAEAARKGVSDIHIEPYESGLVVRMRIDGVLRETLRMPPHVAPILVSRIKVMSRLDIAERRVPQDGRLSLTLGDKLLDIRISTLPSRAGERVVIRLLDKENVGLTLPQLGMAGVVEQIFKDALREPNGVILVTGPTGSGKTTTLYAGLRELNDGSRNILTVEDPVEYAMEGVGQTQVNPKVGLSFAAGLRAILRQDPDIVLVGEIRDRETAEVAVQASLTGHLVLSTVHTNDAVGAITRLRDMKVESFLLASTLRAVLAQRLVRRLCPSCRESYAPDDAVRAMIGLSADAILWRAVGCPHCNDSGYHGRIGVFECIRIDDAIRKMINDDADEAAIARHASQFGPSLAMAAQQLALSGETTVEEALRVSRRTEDE